MNDRPQPVHVVYGGAHLFEAGTVPKLGILALRSLFDNAPDAFSFADAVGLPEASDLPRSTNARISLLRRFSRYGEKARHVHPAAWLAFAVHARVVDKLRKLAVEDYRIDFEDGYGHRANDEEDRHAVQAAEQTVLAMARKTLPPHFGVRIKPFSTQDRPRAIRTLELYVGRLASQTSGLLPENFVVTLPKIHSASEASDLAREVAQLEHRCFIPPGTIRLELMVETPGLLSNPEGRSEIRHLISAAGARCRGIHLGLYDFLSLMGVVSSAQTYTHPYADQLRFAAKAAVAGSDIWLADGATNLIPVGPHRGPGPLSQKQRTMNRDAVQSGWRTIFGHVDHSLDLGYYQGWDLHPSQFVPRYAAVFAKFLRERDAAAQRFRAFIDAAAQATLKGQQFDDAATGQGLLNFFRLGLSCGALTEADLAAAGIGREHLRDRSFASLVDGRGEPGADRPTT